MFNPSLAELRLGPRSPDSPQTRLHLSCEAVPGFHLSSSRNVRLTHRQVKSGLNTSLPTSATQRSLLCLLLFSLHTGDTLFRIVNKTLEHFSSAIKTIEGNEIFIKCNNLDGGVAKANIYTCK